MVAAVAAAPVPPLSGALAVVVERWRGWLGRGGSLPPEVGVVGETGCGGCGSGPPAVWSAGGCGATTRLAGSRGSLPPELEGSPGPGAVAETPAAPAGLAVVEAMVSVRHSSKAALGMEHHWPDWSSTTTLLLLSHMSCIMVATMSCKSSI